jgi:DNA modification methylase
MVGVFREVRRVLRADGTLWLNLGDSYAGGGGFSPNAPSNLAGSKQTTQGGSKPGGLPCVSGLKSKDLVGIPWKLAFALQADGWFLRADIIWAKPNPMPESVTDRPTKAHEYVFLLTKSARYFYDADAVREPSTSDPDDMRRGTGAASNGARISGGLAVGAATHMGVPVAGRNLRSVWTIPSAPFPNAHFATFPPALASRCIHAGSSERGCCRACGAPWARSLALGELRPPASRPDARQCQGDGESTQMQRGAAKACWSRERETIGWQPTCTCDAPPVPCTVLDPFAGSGTVGEVAEQLGRHSVLIELSPAYVRMAEQRTAQYGLFAQERTA